MNNEGNLAGIHTPPLMIVNKIFTSKVITFQNLYLVFWNAEERQIKHDLITACVDCVGRYSQLTIFSEAVRGSHLWLDLKPTVAASFKWH